MSENRNNYNAAQSEFSDTDTIRKLYDDKTRKEKDYEDLLIEKRHLEVAFDDIQKSKYYRSNSKLSTTGYYRANSKLSTTGSDEREIAI